MFLRYNVSLISGGFELNMNIEKVSALMRWVVFILIGSLLFGLFHYYTSHQAISFGTDPELLTELWFNSEANKGVLISFIVPPLILVMLFAYWIQKLFLLFKQSEFFSDKNMHCFLWLVWLNFTSGVDELISPYLLAKYANSFGEDLTAKMVFQPINFFTTLLLVVIVYLLKAAKQIEQENKEFI